MDIENCYCNPSAAHWGQDSVFPQGAEAIVDFLLTLFSTRTLLPCFWRWHPRLPLREDLAMIGLGAQRYPGLVDGQPWSRQWTSGIRSV